MRVLICGGRDLNEQKACDFLLDFLKDYDISLVIEGGARGGDRAGRMFAEKSNIPFRTFNADWDRYGKRAGRIRNQQMLDEGFPDLIIALPGGRGTANMIEISEGKIPQIILGHK